MILVDYSSTAISAITASDIEMMESLPFAREKILNSIKKITRKFKKEYGEVVICVDDKGASWRKEFFPYYKASRKKAQDDSGLNWKAIYKNMYEVLDEIKENFHYKVIKCDRAEADDIMATLALQNDGLHVVVSKDKDMTQLTRYENIKVWSPLAEEFIIQPNLDFHVFCHICKGDRSDGITNILSPDDTLITEGVRQKPVSTKNLEKWYADRDEFLKEHGEKFERNKTLISLFEIPEDITESIIDNYKSYETKSRVRILSYLAESGLGELASRVGDF